MHSCLILSSKLFSCSSLSKHKRIHSEQVNLYSLNQLHNTFCKHISLHRTSYKLYKLGQFLNLYSKASPSLYITFKTPFLIQNKLQALQTWAVSQPTRQSRSTNTRQVLLVSKVHRRFHNQIRVHQTSELRTTH